MSFGKRGSDNQSAHPAAPPPPSRPQMVAASASSASNGPFIALVAAVVLLAGGAAFAAPAATSWIESAFSGQAKVRPIAEIVAGLDQREAHAALAAEAFPDKSGRAFMQTLNTHYPTEHDALVAAFTETAMNGGDRKDLILDLNNWGARFTLVRLGDFGRTGARGFDAFLDMADDAVDIMNDLDGGGCNLRNLKRYGENPNLLVGLGDYGTPLYRMNMDASRTLVELAAYGANQPRPDTTLTSQDEEALQRTLMALVRDPWVVDLQMQVMRTGAIPKDDDLPNIDICKFARSAIKRVRSLPDGTKARVLAMGSELYGPMVSQQALQLGLR